MTIGLPVQSRESQDKVDKPIFEYTFQLKTDLSVLFDLTVSLLSDLTH